MPGTDGAPLGGQQDERIRVYLLDDHEVVREGLRFLLERTEDIEVVGESATAAEAIARIPAVRPDVAVLDARLPDGSGIEVCRAVRSVDPSIKALILTSYDDDEALFAAIMAGAAGYVLKEIRSSDLVSAIRTVAAGQSLIDPALTARVLDRVRNGPSTAPELAKLTEKELQLLALIAEGMTNRQIGEQMFLAEKTVKNYVSAILAKLGLERRTQAAVLAAKLLSPPRPPDRSAYSGRAGSPGRRTPGAQDRPVGVLRASVSARSAYSLRGDRPRPSPTLSRRDPRCWSAAPATPAGCRGARGHSAPACRPGPPRGGARSADRSPRGARRARSRRRPQLSRISRWSTWTST